MRNLLAALLVLTGVAHADEEPAPAGEEPTVEEPAVEQAPSTTPSSSGDEQVIEREPPRRTPFDRGRMSLSIAGGTTSNFDKRYFAIGAGFGYYVLDGVELGISAVHQFGDGPSISNVRPRVTYVVQPLVGKFPLIPYVGAFYNHWFIGDDFPDIDAVGGRVGLIYVSGRVLLGLGIAVERIVSDCPVDMSGSEECWDYYPDFTLSISL